MAEDSFHALSDEQKRRERYYMEDLMQDNDKLTKINLEEDD